MPDIIHKDFTVELPKNFIPLVKVGDSVAIDQPVAKESLREEEVINIPQHLGVPLSKVKNILKKNPGDPVKMGDIIALKKSFLGNEEAVISKVEGIVSRYERTTGNLLIRTSLTASAENVISPVAGTISMCDNGRIVITQGKEVEEIEGAEETKETEGTKDIEEQGVGDNAGIGEEAEGELFVLEESFSTDDSENVLYDLDSKATGKVVLGGVLTRDILMKGIGIGVTGFLGSKISKEDLDFFVHKQTKTPIIQIDEDTAEALKFWKHKQVKIDGKEKMISLSL